MCPKTIEKCPRARPRTKKLGTKSVLENVHLSFLKSDFLNFFFAKNTKLRAKLFIFMSLQVEFQGIMSIIGFVFFLVFATLPSVNTGK